MKRYQIALLIVVAIALGWGLAALEDHLRPKPQPTPVVVEELK